MRFNSLITLKKKCFMFFPWKLLIYKGDTLLFIALRPGIFHLPGRGFFTMALGCFIGIFLFFRQRIRKMIINIKKMAAGIFVLAISLGIAGVVFACPFVPSQQYGGSGGSAFSDDLTQASQLVQLSIWSGQYVDAIQATWSKPGGGTFTGAKHGGGGGGLNVITFKSGEYITRVDGRAGQFTDQLTFTTNLGNKYGPYGGGGGSPYSISNLKVGGFLGRSGSYLDAFGVFNSI
ncbi:MAG: jacalin-like lectin [Methylobacter sp.]